MKDKNIANKKYKNAAIIFELLVRQVTSDTLANKPISEALNILNKYFHTSTELGKELQLYRVFLEMNSLSEAKAIHFIDLVTGQHRKLNDQKLATEKYEIIKEIGQYYPLQDFLSAKIPNYTLYASVYKTFLSAKWASTGYLNIREVATARFTIIEQLTGKIEKQPLREQNETIDIFNKQSEELRLLAYRFVIDRFNEKYSNLNTKQKNLLREYINNVTDTNSLTNYVRQEIPSVHTELQKLVTTTKEPIIAIKLQEVMNHLSKMGTTKTIKDAEVTALIIAYQIIDELKS